MGLELLILLSFCSKKITMQRKDILTGTKVIEKQAKLDQQAMDDADKNRRKFLRNTLINYTFALSVKAEGDLSSIVSRVISLWFSNAQDDAVNSILSKLVQRYCTAKIVFSGWSEFGFFSYFRVSSSLFVPLLYQLAARLNRADGEDANFQHQLRQLILKCAQKHPFHAVPVLLALVNADVDEIELGGMKEAMIFF